jgi:purine-nucleoside phosphorylase
LSSDWAATGPERGRRAPAADDSAGMGGPYAAAAASAAALAERTGRRQHDVAVVLGSGWAPAADALARAAGQGAAPAASAPAGPAPAASAPAESIPAGPAAGPAPAESAPAESIPAESIPAEPAAGPAPAESIPAEPAAGPAPAGPVPAVTEVPLADLGGFPPPTVAGHSPVVRSLALGGLRVLVFLGRTHLYEGHPVGTVVHGVRTAVAAGCRVVVLTNAAGGIRSGYQVGQPVLIRDHLNLTARSPLAGDPPPDGYPPRFTDLTDLYSARLRALARRADPSLAEGVYAALPGPHYETPAEIAMLRGLGADLVGMSTALEAIAARHLGAEVLAISLVTNLAAGLAPGSLDHQEVIAAGRAAAVRMGSLLAGILPGIG